MICKNACENTNRKQILKTFENEDMKILFENLVYESDVPVIVYNEMKNWRLTKMDLKEIIKLFNNPNEPIMEEHLCFFDHTIQENYEKKILLLEQVKHLSNYSFMWENCGKTTSKKIKKLIFRPSFLPNNFELISNSWIFATKDNDNDFLNIPATLRISFFCQISGKSKIKIFPVQECEKICPLKTITIESGQMRKYTFLKFNINFFLFFQNFSCLF